MVSKYTSRVDKLARQILKASTKGPAGQKLTLPIIEGWLYGELPDNVGGAIAHAIQEGWLAYREGAWVVTPAGEEIGKRSRAGVRNKVRRL
jgi:hypothetical protein